MISIQTIALDNRQGHLGEPVANLLRESAFNRKSPALLDFSHMSNDRLWRKHSSRKWLTPRIQTRHIRGSNMTRSKHYATKIALKAFKNTGTWLNQEMMRVKKCVGCAWGWAAVSCGRVRVTRDVVHEGVLTWQLQNRSLICMSAFECPPRFPQSFARKYCRYNDCMFLKVK